METIGYYENQARRNHPEIRDEWVEQVVANPHHTEIQDDGRVRHYGYSAEAGRWIRVVLDDGKLLNRFFDRGGIAKMGNTGNPKLRIEYDGETDTLWLGNGRPTPNGEDISDAVVVFFDDDDRPNAVSIDHAAELLLPLLTALGETGTAGKVGTAGKSGKGAAPVKAADGPL